MDDHGGEGWVLVEVPQMRHRLLLLLVVPLRLDRHLHANTTVATVCGSGTGSGRVGLVVGLEVGEWGW